jgi:Tfp pilus assembly protein PilF
MSGNTDPTTNAELQALLKQGFDEFSRGNTAAAGQCCQQALQIQPDLVPGHFLVGLVALEAKSRKTAFSAFQSVVKLDKNHAAAWAHLAKLYMSEGQVNLADAALRETLRIKPDDPIVLDLIGTTLSLMGEHTAAQSCFGRANTKRQNYPPFMLNLANNLVYHGDTDAADTIFSKIIELQPDSPQAHWALSSSTKATDTKHIEIINGLESLRESKLPGPAIFFPAKVATGLAHRVGAAAGARAATGAQVVGNPHNHRINTAVRQIAAQGQPHIAEYIGVERYVVQRKFIVGHFLCPELRRVRNAHQNTHAYKQASYSKGVTCRSNSSSSCCLRTVYTRWNSSPKLSRIKSEFSKRANATGQ